METYRVLPTLPSLLQEPGRPFIHRDVSWLQFNERVLDEARASAGNPLLERAKFIAITASNLDEFFMIRFSSLGRSIRSSMRNKDDEAVGRLTAIRNSILESVAKFGAKQDEVLDQLTAELERSDIHIVRDSRENEVTEALGKRVFEAQVLPKLSPPETFEPSKLNLLENLKIAVVFPEALWFRISRTIPAMYSARSEDGGVYFFFLDDLLKSFLGPTFGMGADPGLVRLTRDADFTVDIGDHDPALVPDMVRKGLGGREIGAPVRLQYSGNFVPDFLHQAATALKLHPGQMLPASPTAVFHGLWTVFRETPEEIRNSDKLQYPKLKSVFPKDIAVAENIFSQMKEQDFLLHHPFDSFDALVSWIEAAANDPDVVMIEQTIYRMDRFCPLIDSLKKAASKKRVRVLIELRARFDELNNLRLADDLRKAGVEVAYGFGKLKLHAKVTLVTRLEGKGVNRYTHLSTGNYNSTTAKLYTDMAILTANSDIGSDARTFFDSAWEGKVPHGFKKLVTAPTRLHQRLLKHIDQEIAAAEAGETTRIVAKVNALVDEGVVDALYKASRAGVSVDLIVRGACSLIPGVPGLSDNIRVISVVDRFLEHSRIYYFESQRAMYFSSADWMPRNFFSRLEIAYPILDERIYSYIKDVVFPTYLADNHKARELTQQGTWKRRAHRRGKRLRSQFVFEKLAVDKYHGTPLNLN